MARSEYGAIVTCFVTGNANVMNDTQKILKSEFEDLIIFGCSAHLGNLLAEKICPSDLIEQIKSVQKFFKKHQIPSALLLEKEGLFNCEIIYYLFNF